MQKSSYSDIMEIQTCTMDKFHCVRRPAGSADGIPMTLLLLCCKSLSLQTLWVTSDQEKRNRHIHI